MKTANKVIMFIAGLLLAAAACLKFHEAVVVYIPSWREHGIWESYEFFLFQIPLEFALGVWVLSGLFRKAAWIAGTLAYFAFIFITLAKGIMGVESCGCFGQIHVDPWYTLFIIDIPLFLLLAIFRPKGEKLLPPPWPNTYHALAVAVPAIGFMAIAAPLLVAMRPEFKKPEMWTSSFPPIRPVDVKPPITDTHPEINLDPTPDDPMIVHPPEIDLRPDPAPDAPQWPWLQHIDIADELSEGIAVILMYHHDCPTCAEMVPLYSEYCARLREMGEEAMKIAFVAIPPYHEDGPVPDDTTCLLGLLSEDEKWAIMSPYVVALIDGGFVRHWPQGTAPEPQTILDEIFAAD